MPLRNRVTPFGELIADPARGLVYGTRVITPPSLVSVLRSGWRPLVPMLHPSAS